MWHKQLHWKRYICLSDLVCPYIFLRGALHTHTFLIWAFGNQVAARIHICILPYLLMQECMGGKLSSNRECLVVDAAIGTNEHERSRSCIVSTC